MLRIVFGEKLRFCCEMWIYKIYLVQSQLLSSFSWVWINVRECHLVAVKLKSIADIVPVNLFSILMACDSQSFRIEFFSVECQISKLICLWSRMTILFLICYVKLRCDVLWAVFVVFWCGLIFSTACRIFIQNHLCITPKQSTSSSGSQSLYYKRSCLCGDE